MFLSEVEKLQNSHTNLHQERLSLAKAGNLEALEALIVVHQNSILRLCMHLLGDIEDAKDASQEVFIRFFKYLKRFDDERALSPWLYKIAVNVCKTSMKKRSIGQQISFEEALSTTDESLRCASSDHDRALQRFDQQRILMMALKVLSRKERTAFVLRDIEGLETKAVAKLMGTTQVTVRSQASSARLKIKKFRDQLIQRESWIVKNTSKK